MYDDLLESQRPSKLEWFVLNTLIPSLFVTSLMHADVVWSIHKPMHAAGEPLGVRGYCFAPSRPVSPDLLQHSGLKQPPITLKNGPAAVH